MQEIIFIIHILAALCLVFLVLIQHGKGADVGAAFGSGASNTMFGGIGSVPFLIKVTTLIAAIFFATSVTLGVIVAKQAKQATIKTHMPMTPFEDA
ncbi:preprotein translocase subunit SecG [Gammaproteobacteria bacterium]